MHSDKILREGKCKHSFVDMPIMLYLKLSLSSFVTLRIAKDFLSKENKYYFPSSAILRSANTCEVNR